MIIKLDLDDEEAVKLLTAIENSEDRGAGGEGWKSNTLENVEIAVRRAIEEANNAKVG